MVDGNHHTTCRLYSTLRTLSVDPEAETPHMNALGLDHDDGPIQTIAVSFCNPRRTLETDIGRCAK
jgi:hypothetical protein